MPVASSHIYMVCDWFVSSVGESGGLGVWDVSRQWEYAGRQALWTERVQRHVWIQQGRWADSCQETHSRLAPSCDNSKLCNDWCRHQNTLVLCAHCADRGIVKINSEVGKRLRPDSGVGHDAQAGQNLTKITKFLGFEWPHFTSEL